MQLWIDADACPVKEEALRVAARYGLGVTLVSNQGMRPIRAPNVTQKVVSAAFDAADDWIIEQMQAGDVVVTTDIQLAARALEKGGHALNATGSIFTPHNIGERLAARELSAYLREAGEISGHNASFTQKDRSNFLQALDTLIQKHRKR